jgi:hypothetical protein
MVKTLLSYHVQREKDSKGLEDLDLIAVEKGEREKYLLNYDI